ncbi:MAG: phage tail length tape measure family protein [Pseudomonadota bacterium]
MTLRTSLVLAGDSKGAEAALANTERAMAAAATEAAQLKSAFAAADAATSRLARAQATARAEAERLKAAHAAGELSIEQYNRGILETRTALSLVSAAHSKTVADLRTSQAAFDAAANGAKNNVVSLRGAQAGYVNLGRQVQDVAVQLQSGTNLGTIVAQQGGQIADAVAMMGGRFSGLAKFLAGPWGAAITVGAGLLINMASAFRDNTDAAAEAEKATEGFSKRLSDIANFFDLSTGAILRQNDALIENARLKRLDQVDEARARQRERGARIGRLVAESASDQYENRGSIADPMFVSAGRDLTIVNAIRKAGGDQKKINQELLALSRGKGETARIARQIFDERGQATFDAGEIKRLTLEEQSLRTGQLASELRTGGRVRPRSRPRSTGGASLAAFGDSAESRIARIKNEWAGLPTIVEKSNDAFLQLDKLTAEIARKGAKLVDGPQLIAQIEDVRKTIYEGLNKPYNDFMEKQRESAEIDKLLLQGRVDEAAALRVILGLKGQQKPLDEQQLKAILATVQGARQLSMVLRDQQAIIQENLNAVFGLRGALEDAFAGLAAGKGLNPGNVIKQIGDSYAKIAGRRITEALFGDALRMLEDKANGVSPVKVAGERLATELDKTGKAAESLTNAFLRAGGKIAPDATGGSGTSEAPVPGAAKVQTDGTLEVSAGKTENLLEKMLTELQQAGEIVRDSTRLLLDPLAELFNKTFGTQFFTGISQAVSGAMYGYATGGVPGGILGGLKELKGLPESLTKGLGKALGGAQTGTIVAGVANAVGIKLSKTGSQIGGAIGSFLPIPGGQIIGSIVGGLIGKLFGKTKTGGVSLGLVNGKAGVTGTGGNSASLKSQLTGSAGSINSAIGQIAQALGGDLGNFSVAIGKRKDEFRVSASGSVANTTAKKTGADIIYKGKDEAEAIQAALRNAIADGAVTGLSAAVQQALKSSPDIDAAIKEALKVQDVELLVGGIGAQIEKQLKDFEKQAAERLRIARQYGFDVVKLEERNAKDRIKLTDKLLDQQVGSLQALLDELSSGSLFEGSSVDRRNALLAQISTAKAAADAGEEGAADKLAKLLEDLNAVSKEAFGTTGGFAADRSTIQDVARDTIAKANQRIAEAQKVSDPALAETNAALDENNGQNAQIIAILQAFQAQLGSFSGVTGSASRALTELARNV